MAWVSPGGISQPWEQQRHEPPATPAPAPPAEPVPPAHQVPATPPVPAPPPPATDAADDIHASVSAPAADALATALGNATLLGVGYLLRGRKLAAACATVVSVTLMVIIANAAQPAWFWRVTLLLWWLAMIGHGWLSARRSARAVTPYAVVEPVPSPQPAPKPRPVVRRQRAVAATAAAVTLVGAVGLALDARRIEASAADAHRSGDCAKATEILERIGARHRLVDPYVAGRTRRSLEACDLLLAAFRDADSQPDIASQALARYLDHPSALWPQARDVFFDLLLAAAREELTRSLSGDDTSPLAHAVELLTAALALHRGRADDVNVVLDDYVGRLPDIRPCYAMAHLEWVDRSDAFVGVADHVAAVAPSILVNCGMELLEDSPQEAREIFQTVLDRYPKADAAETARELVDKADTILEELRLREVLGGGSEASYCEAPVPSRGAPAYRGRGPHLIVVAEDVPPPDDHIPMDERSYDDGVLAQTLPSQWFAEDVADAALVLCASLEGGQLLATCLYEGDLTLPLLRQRIHVRAYEVRTGELAFELTVETGGGSCPSTIYHYENLPPVVLYAPARADEVRDALRPKIAP